MFSKSTKNLYAGSFPLPDEMYDIWASFLFHYSSLPPSSILLKHIYISSDNAVKLQLR